MRCNRFSPVHHRRQRGFTLLEVLIALALFGLMLSLIFGTLQMASRTWESGEVHAEQLAGRMVLERFLRRVLGSARLWSGSAEAEPSGLAGESRELRFNAYLTHTASVAGLQRFTLYLARNDNHGQDLKVRVAPVGGEVPQGEEDLRDLVLLENVKRVRFAYWLETVARGGEWVDRWDEQELPKAVRIEVAREGEAWPPVIVPLTIRGDGPGGGKQLRHGVFGRRLF